MRLCCAIVLAAARLVPSDIRRDWTREWTAEVEHALTRDSAAQLMPWTRFAVIVRCSGAFAHALWLRWDRWRLEMLLQDLKYAIRTLTKKPGYAAVTILTLGIGIGANAAIFSAVHAVLFRPLPFPDPDGLVHVSSTTTTRPNLPGGAASAPDFVDWRAGNQTLSDMAAINAGSIAWSGSGPAEQVPFALVTGGFFNVLQVPAAFGRTLNGEDDAIGGPEVVVISHSLWVRRLGANPNVLDQVMVLDGVPRRIVGVMPRGFAHPPSTELWMPLRFTERDLTTQRGAMYLDVIGRVKPGVPLAAAQSDLAGIVRRLADAYPRTNANRAIALFPLRDAMVGRVREALLMLLAAVGFVLLIVCVNIASLTLTRAIGRTRELAVRAALGAGRGRLINGLLVESLVLAVIGAAAGLLFASWASLAIAQLDEGLGIPLLDQTRLDAAVIAFTCAVAAIAALVFGTLPAWHASTTLDVARRIRDDAGTVTGSRDRQRLRGALIVAETALAVVLLVGAGLLMRSFARIVAVDIGIDAERVQTFTISLPESKYPTPLSRATFIDTLVSRLEQRPDVAIAGAIFGLPLTGFQYVISMSTLDGRQLTDDEQRLPERNLQVRVVTPNYFRAMGIALTRGRPFAPSDRLGAPRVVLVNETAARLLWSDQDPLGHEFTLGTRLGQGGESAGGQVIGIVNDVRDHGPTMRVRPTVYLAHAQFPVDFVAIAIKARADATATIEPARALLAELDPDLPMFRVRTMEQFAANAIAQPRLYLTMIGLFAIAAVVLAAIGIYGVLMFAVAQRTREIGIRLALGAKRSEVIGLVIRQATGLACGGLIIGLAMAAGAAQLIRDLLFGIEPGDTITYAAVAAALTAVALLASYLPARRAARVDPITALRYE